MSSTFEITLADWQVEIFLNSDRRFVIVPKGRRVGGTIGMAYACVIWILSNRASTILWGDTIQSNIDRYVSRYFEPILKKLNVGYKYNKVSKQLQIKGGWIDFRSADRPENWEGFGYDVVCLNEAGIILKDEYLYSNSVLPMLLDNPNSRLFAIGTPKGKYLKDGREHPFYRLYIDGLKDKDKYLVRTITTFDSPFLQEDKIRSLMNEIKKFGDAIVKQELYGEFIERDMDLVFTDIVLIDELPDNLQYIYGLDFGYVKDPTALIKLGLDNREKKIYVAEMFYGVVESIETIASMIKSKIDKSIDLIVADSHGQQIAMIRELQGKGLNVQPMKSKAVIEGILKMLDYDICVTKSSSNLIRELNTYSFIDKVGKVVQDHNNHAIDAMRYAFDYVNPVGQKKGQYYVV